MNNGFVFAGKSTRDLRMLVERYPAQKGAARKRTTVPVPGRNGDLHYDEGAFENYQQPYECGFRGDRPTPEQAHAIKEWLLSSGTYQRLEDVYDPDYFRLATFAGPLDIENQLNKIGKCVVTFDCKPQSFLKSGEYPVSLTVAGVLWNPTAFAAKPLITVYGSSAGTVTIGNIAVEIKSITDWITLDCDLQHAYRGDVSMNACIKAIPFPELLPGDNAISWTGGISKIEIIPRWWTL